MPEIGDKISTQLDRSYVGYREWCDWRGLTPASFASWVRQEQGLGAHSLTGGGVILRSPQQTQVWRQSHRAEIETRRQASLRSLGITPALR